MLNHLSKIVPIITMSLVLSACHKPPVLNNELALSILNSPDKLSGYTVSIVTNNPTARGKNALGWSCSDQKPLVDAGLVKCKTAGRSGVYLTFTDEGKKLLVGRPWGDTNLRNARVIAVKQKAATIDAIHILSKTQAKVDYTSVYSEYTPFANTHIQALIPLGTPQSKQAEFVVVDNEWVLK